MERTYFDHEPVKYEPIGNGSYFYRWDIKEEHIEPEEGSEEPAVQWSSEEVVVWAPITANKITQAVIEQIWAVGYEQKLINEYNGAKMGLYGDPDGEEAQAKIDQYLTFLIERGKIKAQIDKDCEDLNIK